MSHLSSSFEVALQHAIGTIAWEIRLPVQSQAHVAIALA
jgi:hypothetical protein